MPTTFSIEARRSNGSLLTSSCPASILEMSSTSLISASRCRALSRTMPSCLRCSAFSGPASPCRMMPVKPMIELSGVRNSCDMVARNADFRRSAASARSLATASSAVRSATRCSRRGVQLPDRLLRPLALRDVVNHPDQLRADAVGIHHRDDGDGPDPLAARVFGDFFPMRRQAALDGFAVLAEHEAVGGGRDSRCEPMPRRSDPPRAQLSPGTDG